MLIGVLTFTLTMGAFLLLVDASPTIPDVVENDGVLWAGPAWRQEVEGLRILYFQGTPEEMGIQHGLLALDDAERVRQAVRKLDPVHTAQGFADRLRWRFLDLYARLQFVPKFRSHIPREYLEEMRGFVIGASRGEDRKYDEVLMANVSQDLMMAAPACSAVAAWGEATVDGELYVGRNLDHPALMALAEYQQVAIYEPATGYRFAVHGYPAHVGTMSGMNEHGLVLSSNYSLAAGTEQNVDGMPYMIMIRHILQYAADLDEALAMILTTPRTMGLNLMLADAKAGKAVIVEVSANRMAVREGAHYVYASNMYQDPYMQEYQGPGWMASTLRDQRFAQLRDRHWSSLDVAVIRDILRDKLPPERHERPWFNSSINSEVNMASMVFVPGRGEAWVGVITDKEVPFAADGAFVGVDIQAVWETGQPQTSLGVLPATKRVGYDKHWFMAREAVLLFNQGRLEEALDLVTPVLAEYPDAGIPLYLKGRILARGGELAKALPYLQRFVEFSDHQEPFYELLGVFWSAILADHLGDRETAVSLYQQVLGIHVDDLDRETDAYTYWARLGSVEPLMLRDGRVVRQ